MSASRDFTEIQRMLNDCAPGYTFRITDHFRRVTFGSLIYPSLPKSKKIEIGHIHKMVRYFKIQECAKKYGMV